MTAALDLLISVVALVGLAWSARQIVAGRAGRHLLVTINVGLLSLLVLLYQFTTTV